MAISTTNPLDEIQYNGTVIPLVRGSEFNVGTATVSVSTTSNSISFSGLLGAPIWFDLSTTASSASDEGSYILAILYDGSSLTGYVSIWSGSVTGRHQTTGYSQTYANNTLTVTSSSSSSNGQFFRNVTFTLRYIY